MFLPKRYLGGDPVNNLPALTAALRKLGAEGVWTAESLAQGERPPDLFACDTQRMDSPSPTVVTILANESPKKASLSAQINAYVDALPDALAVVDRRAIATAYGPGVEVRVGGEWLGEASMEICYFVQTPNATYGIAFLTGAEGFQGQRRVFAESVETFRETK